MPDSIKRPPPGFGGPQMPIEGQRELVVMTRRGMQFQPTAMGFAPASTDDAASLEKVLSASGATLRPLFDSNTTRARHDAAIAELIAPPGAPTPPDLSIYFHVEASDEHLDRLAADLRQLSTVESAYVMPAPLPATMKHSPVLDPIGKTSRGIDPEALNSMVAVAGEAPPATANFTAQQLYLGPAPVGVDATFAWTQPGGRGAGVRIVDVEGEWRFTHEDLVLNQGGVAFGTPPNNAGWRNHGTAVLGEISGDVNAFGITGICPDANVRGVSIFGSGSGTATAIQKAADLLGPGDILLIELHAPGPKATGSGQFGYIAMEWWPHVYDAIRYAVNRGVIVVEAAGNGSQNLDDPVYDTPAAGFPSSWANPFRRTARDSGAILVGAGAPPPGTNGRNHGPDRSRLDFSNYGTAVDVQGWGREVTTSGYGDLQGGGNEDLWYTSQFSGTSSASPIIVGVLGCAQGNRRATGSALLTPASARNLLRSTGSPQQDAPGRPVAQRIGNRPNLRQLLPLPMVLSVPFHRYWNPTATDHFYTTNLNELGRGRLGYRYEGVQCFLFPRAVAGTVPLHRYWNLVATDHFYTTNWNELGGGRLGYRYEGVAGHVYARTGAGRVPLYRYWNPVVRDHFYTTNLAELGRGRNGYVLEGVQCWVATQVRPPVGDEAPELAALVLLQGTELDPGMIPSMGMTGELQPFGMPESFETGMNSVLTDSFPSTGVESEFGSLLVPTTEEFITSTFEIKRATRKGGTSITIRLNEDEA